MEIKFSRHAKRRMQLYKIDEDDVRRTIESAKMSKGLRTGKHEEVNHDLKDKYGYPLKVVFLVENERVMVLTAYPLRRGKVR